MRSFVYGLGGLEIRSSLPIPCLGPAPSGGDTLTILVDRADGPVSREGPILFRWPGRYGLVLRTHGKGWLLSTTHVVAEISEDRFSVRCHPVADSPGWPEVLVRRILPRLAQWHGRLALHASAVADDGSAIVLLGPSGAGKSTLAAALCRLRAWRSLSDDISLIDCEPPGPAMAWPSGAGACLWPDSLAALAPAPERSHSLAGHTHKRWLGVDQHAESAAPARVGAMVVLAPDDAGAIAIRPMAPSDAARRAGGLMMSFNPADPALVARSWAAVGRLVTEVPAFALSYPRRYECLAEVASTLSARLGDRALTTR
jgi:hypothetical protein